VYDGCSDCIVDCNSYHRQRRLFDTECSKGYVLLDDREQRTVHRHSRRLYATRELFYACVNLLVYVNHSINFLMYFVSGRKFRSAAKDTITCQWCRGKLQFIGQLMTAGQSAAGAITASGSPGTQDISLATSHRCENELVANE
jgi:hypothetical protein